MPPVSGINVLLAAGNERQTITISGGADTDTYKLNFRGQKTAAIAKNAAAATIQAALVALSTIGANNAAVTGNVYGPFTVTFQGALAGQDVDLMTVSDITGAVAVVVANTTPSYNVLGAQRGVTWNRAVSEADGTSKDSAGWHEGYPEIRESEIDCDAFVLETDAAYLAMENIWLNNGRLLARLGMPSGSVYTGVATLTKFPINAPHDNLTTIAIGVKISGQLTKA